MKKIQLFVYGTNGKNGKNGADGTTYGSFGANGQHGEHGSSLNPVNIKLSFYSNTQQAIIRDGENFFRTIIANDLYQSTLSIKAIGGNGGNGGTGGRGGNGYNGENGIDATQYVRGTDGKPGGNGGNGGDGGNGGNAGNGGDINISLNQEDMDLLMLIDQVSMASGIRGEGGHGGRGGFGGTGGTGGSPCYWTTHNSKTFSVDTHYNPSASFHNCHSECTFNFYIDASNKRYSEEHARWVGTITYHKTINHKNYGGRNGSAGVSGKNGKDGISGKNGVQGKYSIFINNNGAYSDRYNIIITNFKPLSSDDGIIEPGEVIALNNLTVLNNGFMPTPKMQLIKVSTQVTDWIQPADPIELPGWLPANQKYTSDQALYFTIKPNLHFIPNKVPKAQVTLGWHALVPRVNKYFDSVELQKTTFEVRYPLEISLICNAHAITRLEEAPFVVQVRNVSTLATGTSAGIPRKVQLEISSINGKELNWVSKDNTCSQKLNQPINFDIPLLGANSSYFAAGTFKFIDQNLPFYTNIPIKANLKLGQRNNTSNRSIPIIQSSESTLQLSENYIYDPHSEFLLITNSKTTGEEVAAWKEIILLLGSNLTIWNVSLYSGIDFNYKRKDGGSFIEQLVNKTIIILNNKYIDDFTNEEKTIFTEDLCLAEIYYAAKKAMISTYVVGSRLDLCNQSILQFMTNKYAEQNSDSEGFEQFSIGNAISSQTAIKSYFYCLSLNYENDLKKMANALQKDLYAKNPDKQQIIAYYNNGKCLTEKAGCLSQEHELGEILVWDGISNLQAKIAFCEDNPSSHWQLDTKHKHAFTLLKLLSFEKKLNFLIVNYHVQSTYTLIFNAILSDLADEQYVWRQHKWSGYYPKKILKNSLTTLNFLAEFDFKDLPAERLMIILMQFYSLVNLLPSFWDYCWFYRRGRILTTICKEIIKNIIIKLYPIENIYKQLFNRLATAAKEFKKEFKNNSRFEILEYIRNPYKNIKFNNNKQLINVLNYSQIPAAKIPNRNIVEERYLFLGSLANTTRKEAINKFETLAKSDHHQAKLYLPKPANYFDSPDNLSSSLKFVGPRLRTVN